MSIQRIPGHDVLPWKFSAPRLVSPGSSDSGSGPVKRGRAHRISLPGKRRDQPFTSSEGDTVAQPKIAAASQRAFAARGMTTVLHTEEGRIRRFFCIDDFFAGRQARCGNVRRPHRLSPSRTKLAAPDAHCESCRKALAAHSAAVKTPHAELERTGSWSGDMTEGSRWLRTLARRGCAPESAGSRGRRPAGPVGHAGNVALAARRKRGGRVRRCTTSTRAGETISAGG